MSKVGDSMSDTIYIDAATKLEQYYAWGYTLHDRQHVIREDDKLYIRLRALYSKYSCKLVDKEQDIRHILVHVLGAEAQKKRGYRMLALDCRYIIDTDFADVIPTHRTVTEAEIEREWARIFFDQTLDPRIRLQASKYLADYKQMFDKDKTTSEVVDKDELLAKLRAKYLIKRVK